MAAGGGVFQGENGTKVHLPGANLNDIANQADDLLEVSSSRCILCFFVFSIISLLMVAYFILLTIAYSNGIRQIVINKEEYEIMATAVA